MNCLKCPVRKLLEETVAHERELNKMLQDKLVALANVQAHQSINYITEEPDEQYFGIGIEEELSFDEFGQKSFVVPDKEKGN